MKNIFANWKTSSAGLTMITGAVVHLVFAVIHDTADESTWKNDLGIIIGGIGLIYAGDASVSASKSDMTQVKDAVITGNTEQLKKSDADKK